MELLNQRKPKAADLLLREERLQALRNLAGQIAHDINNYISPIAGYISLLKEESHESADVVKYLNSIENATKRIDTFLDTVLLATRPQRRYRPEVFQLNKVLVEAIESWKSILPVNSGITLETFIQDCKVYGDRILLTNLIFQLLSNARFALATGGRLSVSLTKETLTESQVENWGVSSNYVVKMVFADTGFGISPDIIDKVFDPFFTTRPKGHALGLGLTIVHGVVRLHGGQVLLESQEFIGTKVTVYLPEFVGKEEVHEGAPALVGTINIATEAGTSDKSKLILVVDDDPLVTEVVRACLLKANFTVSTAKDGEEALNVFKRKKDDIGLIISDITMPRMNGIELTLRIREIQPAAKIILMTGDEDAIQSEKLEVLAPAIPRIIKKPFNLKGLIEIVEKTI
jgi:nitrogen-specific signal transduction histidine kinase